LLVPAALELPLFSCPDVSGLLYAIKSSPSSSLFFLPHILHATIANPPRSIAPPIPTTTPITVLLVFEDMPPPDDSLPCDRDAGVLVEVGAGVEVDSETDVKTLPSTVVV